MPGDVQPLGYEPLLEAVKAEIAGARLRAALAANNELIEMYWRIGRLVLDRQADEGWGTGVIDRLATDLRTAFPGARGLSRRNLQYMRALAAAWPEVVPQPVAQLPWGHVRELLDRLEDPTTRRLVRHPRRRRRLVTRCPADVAAVFSVRMLGQLVHGAINAERDRR